MNQANHDLRAWLNEVERIGQLRRISGIPWDKDMGGLVEMILFILSVFVVYAYVWRRGGLDWD